MRESRTSHLGRQPEASVTWKLKQESHRKGCISAKHMGGARRSSFNGANILQF